MNRCDVGVQKRSWFSMVLEKIKKFKISKEAALLVEILLFIASLITGCSSAIPDAGKAQPTPPAKPAAQQEVNQPSKDDFGRYKFTQVGQKLTLDDGSVVELVRIRDINEKVSIKPIEVTVKNIKIFKWSGVPETDRQQFGAMSGMPEVPDPFYYIQVLYDAENKSNQNVQFVGLEKVVLSNGEQLDAMSSILPPLNGEDPQFYGKVKQERAVALVFKGKPEEIKSVKLIFSNSVNPTSFETITPEQQVEYQLK